MTATTETIPARVDSRYRGGMASTAQVDVRALHSTMWSQRAELLGRQYGEQVLDAMREFKRMRGRHGL